MNNPLPIDRELFIEKVEEKLGTGPIDFSENFQIIRESEATSNPLLAAGVLLPFYYRETNSSTKGRSGEFVFRLIKRSNLVTQAGDLACPGGILHPLKDFLLMWIIRSGLIPLLNNKAGQYARLRNCPTFQAIALFLATAVREAWEEIRLNPFHINFLGPLSPYSLNLFPRIIFPLVCHVNMPHRFYPNYEVERLVDIPIAAFYHEENYGMLLKESDTGSPHPEEERETLPCLIYLDQEGRENILWGATFFIIINFLESVFDFQLPDWQNKRLIKKIISPRYLSGAR